MPSRDNTHDRSAATSDLFSAVNRLFLTMSATQTTTTVDHKIADLSLADFGRKEVGRVPWRR